MSLFILLVVQFPNTVPYTDKSAVSISTDYSQFVLT